MKISLKNSLASLEVNTNGAYIDNFEVKDIPIFFPKVMVKIGDILKIRGGMHVCAPNFGVDDTLNSLPSHGFGRDLLWEVLEQRESFIKLSLEGVESYKDVKFTVVYELDGPNLLLNLMIENISDEEKLVAPGFHPYFYAHDHSVVINDRSIDKKELPNSICEDSSNEKFKLNDKQIEIIGIKNINKYVFWSDFKGDYICIEPTYNGNAFDDKEKDIYHLKSNEIFEISCEIRVKL
ncbi:aldose epimerase [Anaerococcus sp. mt242]|uniref:aldose epimerase family protein n=1 Tax=Anaerococcus sp. mt242 TaxID=2661917 RepID=UPI001932EA56|nr:aldose epimerase [Anaerococcus sp. mt242]MBM0045672.1 aldose epimerase [Anaerococcus sp. mt242]